VEQKYILNESIMEGDITCVVWTEDREETPNADSVKVPEPHQVFLPPLPSLTRSTGGEQVVDSKKIQNQKELNLLLVGLSNGLLSVAVLGLFPSVTIDVKKMLNLPECVILDAGTSK